MMQTLGKSEDLHAASCNHGWDESTAELLLHADMHPRLTNWPGLLMRVYHDHCRAGPDAAVRCPALAGLDLAQSLTWHADGLS